MPGSRLANVILACALARDDRQYVLGDLAEEYAALRVKTSPTAATLWCWMQVLRSMPWLWWNPVRRSGWAATLGVAAAACAAQAAVELTAAIVVPGVLPAGARSTVALTLVVVCGSLIAISCLANRVRPGAGVMLTLIVSVATLARTLHAPIEGLHLVAVLENASAPSAALVGAALAVHVRISHKTERT